VEQKEDDMDLALEGKRALVTGSTTGIGEAIVRRLAAEGARVIVHGRTAAQADPLLNALRAEGADAEAARAKARASYQDFLALWKDADPDISILIAAKSEYAKLQ
jgi:NAD(P)-dependent dehydrogenase (short-subunit alcohol dehydrogenase family)